jgi:PIN domain nuclease of toxin-antitoxin system
MIACVVDTHAFIWFLTGDKRLSSTARQHIDVAIKDGHSIVVSSISLVEALYLAEKG